MTEINFKEQKLGESDERLFASTFNDIRQAALAMFKQARQSIKIFTRDGDPRILSDRYIEKALIDFIRSSNRTSLQVLVFDPRNLQTANHRFVALYQQMTSYVDIRRVHKEYLETPYAFYCVDDYGVMYRPIATALETEVYFSSPIDNRHRQNFFKEVWDQSSKATELRALHL